MEKLISALQKKIERKCPNKKGFYKIAIGGAGGAGKTHLSTILAEKLGATHLSLDNYRIPRNQRPENLFGSNPEANYLDLIQTHLDLLSKGHPFMHPIYDHDSGAVTLKKQFRPSHLNIIDGELSLYEMFLGQMDVTIFLESDWETELMRRISRDIKEQKKDPERVLSVFLQSNFKDYRKYSLPQKEKCDLQITVFDNKYFL